MTRARQLSVAVGIGLAVVGVVAIYEFAWSPAEMARLTLSGHTIEIHYSAPSVRGRQIFGADGLLARDPTYPVWRAGANAATTLHTTGELDLNGLTVPAGTYTIYVSVENPDAWELIVSTQTGQWGRSYDRRRDLGRVTMTMSTPPSPVETLRYALIDRSGGKGELRLQWERHMATTTLAMK